MRDIVSPLDGFLSPFGVVRGAFSPSSLFASGEAGAWYEPGVGSLQTSSGEITEAGPGDPVGFQLDKSQGAGFSGGAFTGLGDELVPSLDLTTWTSNGGVSAETANSFTTTSAGGKYLTTIDTTCVITFDYVRSGAASLSVRLGATSNPDIGSTTDNSGTITIFGDVGAVLYLRLSSSGSVTISNFSVREIPGNHAVQSTAAARPTLQATYDGTGALGSELVANGGFDADSDWTKGAGWTISGGKATKTAGLASNLVSISNVVTAGKPYFVSFTISDYSAGALTFYAGIGGSGNITDTLTADGDYEFILLGGTSDLKIYVQGNATFAGSIDNISVREVPEASRLYYLEDDLVDDAINWTAPADTDYTITRINRAGTVTAQTGQSLSGSTDALVEQYVAAYVAVDRALTAGETADLAAYLESL